MSKVAGNQTDVLAEEFGRSLLGGSPPFFSIGNRGGPLQRDSGHWSIESVFLAGPSAANTTVRDPQPGWLKEC